MKEQLSSTNRDLQVTRHPQATRPEFVAFDELFDHVQELHESIEKRAYELFEHDGCDQGRALEHWLSAEKETLHPVAVELRETDDALTVRAEVPGFRGEDLKLSVEPRRLAISGKREAHEEKKSRRTIYQEYLSNQICRSLELPIEIDPSETKAAIQDGVLEISMPKAPRTRQLRVAAGRAT
ncbi:MAG TPA: Hsp20 family protein [Candidatus Acidoferrales bacterium]|nr:Hsp20 family protein [Candidatus Acidoferrales bacterium]